MKEVKDLTQGDLSHLANLATGGYFDSQWSKNRLEVEVGGYGKRKRIEWVMTNDGPDETNSFEISSEGSDGWAWNCQVKVDGKWQLVNTLAPHRLVDYLRENDFNIENNKVKEVIINQGGVYYYANESKPWTCIAVRSVQSHFINSNGKSAQFYNKDMYYEKK